MTGGAAMGATVFERAVGVAARWLEVAALPPADHRPWPLPQLPWVMAQRWEDLLFAHWRVPPELLVRHIPPPLALDTFDGAAWLAVTPFRITGLRPRGLPSLPVVSRFPEVNVRTYVTLEGKPGVWFFSLDAARRLAVTAARRLYLLPYFLAEMTAARRDGRIHYASRRVHAGAPPAELGAEYRPVGPAAPAPPGSLAWFLTERYCLYAMDRRGGVHRAEIHHAPWPLQPAEADFHRNTMGRWLGVPLEGTPLLHFAAGLDVRVWAPTFVTGR